MPKFVYYKLPYGGHSSAILHDDSTKGVDGKKDLAILKEFPITEDQARLPLSILEGIFGGQDATE